MTLQQFLEAEREAFQEHDSCHVGNCYCTSTSECEAKQLNFLTASHHRLIAKVREMVGTIKHDALARMSHDLKGQCDFERVETCNRILTLLETSDKPQ